MILEKMLFLKDDDDRHSRELGFREGLKLIIIFKFNVKGRTKLSQISHYTIDESS